MQIQEHQIKSLKKQRFIIAYLSCMITVVSSCLLFLLSCQTSPHKAPYIYVVQSGDTLKSIAKDAHIATQEISSYNELNNEEIHSGQILLLPGVTRLNKTDEFQKLNIVHRNQWGAAKEKKMNPVSSYDKITIHHTTERKDAPKRNDVHFLKIIQKYHQQERQWADIGYHFIIGKDGTIYEGRLLNFQGAHVRNHNKGNIGIALLGDLNIDSLNKQQEEALHKLISALRKRYSIPQKGLFAHRELGQTSCPGDHVLPFLNKLRD